VSIELGTAGSTRAKGVVPVLRGGAPVAELRASNWGEAATAVVDGRPWIYAKRSGELTARPASDPEHVVRFRARQTSWWRGSWSIDLAGRSLTSQTASAWKGTRRYLDGDRQVAESGTTGGWSPRPTLTADDLPLEQQVFLLWVELVLDRRTQSAAGAAVIGGAAAAGSS
jgi:hypothetical protein